MITNPTTWTLIMFVIASLLAIAFYYGGREDEKKGAKVPRLGICILIIILFLVFLLISTQIDDAICEMRRRLNQPIISKEQLYGYKIVGKKFSQNESLENSLSSLVCLISIEDLLGDKHTLLEDVEASEEFFLKLKIGDHFLPENEPNTPIAESQ